MPVRQARGQGSQYFARADTDGLGEFLGRQVRLVQIVLAAVEVVADLFVRRARGVLPAVTAVGAADQFGQALIAPPQVEEDLGHGRHRLADLIGLDTVAAIAESLYEEFKEPLYAPPPLLQRMVEAGLLGRKTGRGFHTYD